LGVILPNHLRLGHIRDRGTMCATARMDKSLCRVYHSKGTGGHIVPRSSSRVLLLSLARLGYLSRVCPLIPGHSEHTGSYRGETDEDKGCNVHHPRAWTPLRVEGVRSWVLALAFPSHYQYTCPEQVSEADLP
jgi:hypothetical protein